MELGKSNGILVKSIMVPLLKIKRMDMESILTQLVNQLKENGKMVNSLNKYNNDKSTK